MSQTEFISAAVKIFHKKPKILGKRWHDYGRWAGFTGPNYREDPLSPVRSLGLIPRLHRRNIFYTTVEDITHFTKQDWFYNFLALKWCLKFTTSRRDVVNFKHPGGMLLNGNNLWVVYGNPSPHPTCCLCHLMDQKSLGPLYKSWFCAGTIKNPLKWPHLVIFKGWFHNFPPHLQHRDINSYF